MAESPSSAGVPTLDDLPAGFAGTRQNLHRLAEEVVKAAREHVTGDFSLIAIPGGFGTPVFGPDDAQVRVQGVELIVARGGEEARAPITTLRAAAELCGDLLPGDLVLDDAELLLDEACARALGDWYGFGEAVLDRFRQQATMEDEATEATLWPEHFDIAIEMGPNDTGKRANYGFSPDDDDHQEPYLYVGPWTAKPQGELWNGRGFTGAELGHSELVAASDQLGAAIDFCVTRKQALEGAEKGGEE
jgi:hypothetical protein